MADAHEVAPAQEEIEKLGGAVESYAVPEETVETAEAAEEVKPVDAA